MNDDLSHSVLAITVTALLGIATFIFLAVHAWQLAAITGIAFWLLISDTDGQIH